MICNVDTETYSSYELSDCGVYRYVEAPDFCLLLLGYHFEDEDEFHVIDVANGERVEDHKRLYSALCGDNPENVKFTAWNASFERQVLRVALNHPMPPEQWDDTMVRALELGLPGSLAGAGIALGLPAEKLKDLRGKALINYFSKPCKPTKSNNGRTRNLPAHDPDKWKLYIEYNRQDVVTEQAIRDMLLKKVQPTESEWDLWYLDQRMNDCGVRIDLPMVKNIVAYDARRQIELQDEAREITGLENPNSLVQLKTWLAERGIPMEEVTKDTVNAALKTDLAPEVRRVLEIRKALGKSSVKKFHTMLDAVCEDQRIRGTMQFYGAARTGRFAGRLVQVHNLSKNYLEDLDLARQLACEGRFDDMDLLFGEPAFVFSELVRTAFIPSPGCRFVVADFSAIEARVLGWLAGEEWVLKAFREGKDIYCETASQMYHCNVVKHGENGHLRQKGKVAVLACGYQGGVGAMKRMDREGAIPEDELQSVVDQWRMANGKIVKFWRTVELAAKTAIRDRRKVKIQNGMAFYYEGKNLYIQLPSGRSICYWNARIKEDSGKEYISFWSVNTMRQWEEEETYGGKITENCLAGDTMTLTDSGWKPLRTISESDLLWDGSEWVKHNGLIDKEEQLVIKVDGVRMTPDHLVLTDRGWICASSCEGHNRHEVQLPDSIKLRRVKWKEESVERPMRSLRKRIRYAGFRILQRKAKVMRVYDEGAAPQSKQQTRNVESTDMECLAFDEGTMRDPNSPSMEKLRGQRNQSLRQMVEIFRGFLCGHVTNVSTGVNTGSNRCKWQLLPGELSLGYDERTGKEQTEKPFHQYSVGNDNSGRSSRKVWNRSNNNSIPAEPRSPRKLTVSETGLSERVYDIRSAGPRHCFTVMGNHGPLIVHNCTQAVARDCLAETIKRVTAMGYQIVMHVHDEVIVDVPKSDTEAYEKILSAMKEPIPWAPGLPLNADGYTCDYYKKD